jgi:hypothetical protein
VLQLLLCTLLPGCALRGATQELQTRPGIHAVPTTATHGAPERGADNGTTMVFGGGKLCDLAKCTCAGVDLSAHSRLEYQTVDHSSHPFSYMFSLCAPLPEDILPLGCKGVNDAASVVKYDSSNPSHCTEIGSVGPCTVSNSYGMFANPAKGGLDVHFVYAANGCTNSFTLQLREGKASGGPQKVTVSGADPCPTYTARWNILSKSQANAASCVPPPPPPVLPFPRVPLCLLLHDGTQAGYLWAA